MPIGHIGMAPQQLQTPQLVQLLLPPHPAAPKRTCCGATPLGACGPGMPGMDMPGISGGIGGIRVVTGWSRCTFGDGKKSNSRSGAIPVPCGHICGGWHATPCEGAAGGLPEALAMLGKKKGGMCSSRCAPQCAASNAAEGALASSSSGAKLGGAVFGEASARAADLKGVP